MYKMTGYSLGCVRNNSPVMIFVQVDVKDPHADLAAAVLISRFLGQHVSIQDIQPTTTIQGHASVKDDNLQEVPEWNLKKASGTSDIIKLPRTNP